MSEPISRADAIAQAIQARLEVITQDNDYLTNCGANVFRGRRAVRADQVPAAVLVEEEDDIADQRETSLFARLPFTVHAMAEVTPETESSTAHALVVDLKRCLFDPEWVRTLTDQKLIDPKFGVGYMGRVINPRDEGGNVIEVMVRLRVWYAEDLINP